MMNILHLNAGNETGGGMYHIIHLLEQLTKDHRISVTLGLFEKKALYHLAKEKEIKTVYFPHKTKISMTLLNRLATFIERENISIVHTHGPRANVYINSIRKKVPFYWITTVHSDPQFDFKEKGIYGRFLYYLHVNAIKNSHKIITVCDSFQRSLTKSFVKQEKMTTILNGLNFTKDNNEKTCREKLGFKENDFIFLQVARLERVKGHHIALKAFAKLKKQVKNCRLIFVGGGSLKQELRQLAKLLKISDDVIFFGEQRDVNPFYQLADITLLSSLSEGFPLVLLESARAKTPVISTNVGGINQLIINETVGWKVQPNCKDQLAQAMQKAYELKGSGQLRIIGESLFEYASLKFSLENFANNVYNVYEDVGSMY